MNLVSKFEKNSQSHNIFPRRRFVVLLSYMFKFIIKSPRMTFGVNVNQFVRIECLFVCKMHHDHDYIKMYIGRYTFSVCHSFVIGDFLWLCYENGSIRFYRLSIFFVQNGRAPLELRRLSFTINW